MTVQLCAVVSGLLFVGVELHDDPDPSPWAVPSVVVSQRAFHFSTKRRKFARMKGSKSLILFAEKTWLTYLRFLARR